MIYDEAGTVLSLPPLINGEHSKMSASTSDIFIESTALDITRAKVVLNTMVTCFSRYSSSPFSIEPVLVEYEEIPGPGVERVNKCVVLCCVVLTTRL